LILLLMDLVRETKYSDAENITQEMFCLDPNSLVNVFLEGLCLFEQEKQQEAFSSWQRLAQLGVDDTSFTPKLTECVDQIWGSHAGLVVLERIITRTAPLQNAYVSYALLLGKIKILWKINKEDALHFYFQYPELQIYIIPLIPELRKFALSKLVQFLDQNRKIAKTNPSYRKINSTFVLESCNEIIKKCLLYEMEGLTIPHEQIKDRIETIHSGPILVARTNLNEEQLGARQILYDILY